MTKNVNRPLTATAPEKSDIAPGWEVQTAKLQDANGLRIAGLSELERSANLGRTTGKVTPAAGRLEDLNLTSDYYKNRSCLRTYLLGCRPKKYLKTAQNCARPASVTARKRKEAQELVDLGKKNNQNCLLMCTSSH